MSLLKVWIKSPSFWIILIGLACLLGLPLFVSLRYILNMVLLIAISAVFAISYNLLCGYTGVFSLGHALFFGCGAYLVGIAMFWFGTSMWLFFLAIIAAVILAALLGLLIGFLTLRLKAIYFAMVTFAVGALFVIIADKWREVTHGPDGLSFQMPELLMNRFVVYYIIIAFFIAIVFAMYRFLESPTGKVLVAIRENESRSSSLGYDVFRHKLISSVVAGVVACLAGVGYAMVSHFVLPELLDVNQTMNGLLMTILGGIGTLAGPIIGAVVMTLIGDWLAELSKLHPILERWPIIFGLLYIVIILTMPGGIMSGYYKFKYWWSKRAR